MMEIHITMKMNMITRTKRTQTIKWQWCSNLCAILISFKIF